MVSVSQPYPLDSTHPAAPAHLSSLAFLYDRFTLRRLTGPRGTLRNLRVLEVGAGRGHLAHDIASLVGDRGEVTALDLHPDVPGHPRIRVVQHDLRSPDPIPVGPCDVVHARLVLAHLPEREEILDRLLAVATDGAMVLIEEWEPCRTGMVLAAPSGSARALYERYAAAAGAVFDAAGTDGGWARRVHTALRTRGLRDVETVVTGEFWVGGGHGCGVIAAVIPQIADRLQAHGLSRSDVAAVVELLHDDRLVLHPHLLYSTAGYIPGIGI